MKRLLLLLLALLGGLWAQPAEAAIAIDSRGQCTADGGGTTLNCAFTNTAGTFLVVAFSWQSGTGESATSCTYNGVAMSEKWDVNSNDVWGTAGYMLGNPATGSNTLECILSGTGDAFNIFAISFTGVTIGSAPWSTSHRTVYTETDALTATCCTVTVVDSQNGDVVVDSVITFNATITVGAGQDSTSTEDDAIAGGSDSGGMSTESATGGNTVMTWTGGVVAWGQGATALIPAAAGGATPTSRLLLLGCCE